MKRIVGLTLALVLTLALSAAAEQTMGTVKGIDRADNSIVLDDGTKLWLSEGRIANIAPGDQVQAVYETQGGKKVVTDLGRRTLVPNGHFTTDWQGESPIDLNQSE